MALENRIITYHDDESEEPCQAKVVSYTKGIGVTIVDATDPNYNLLCIHGPESPLLKAKCDKDKNLKKMYTEIMATTYKGLIKKQLRWSDIQKVIDFYDVGIMTHSNGVPSEACVFNN